MSWNRNDSSKQRDTGRGRRGVPFVLLVAFVPLALALGVALWWALRDGGRGGAHGSGKTRPSRVAEAAAKRAPAPSREGRGDPQRRVREELGEKVREFITRPMTNALHFIGEIPLDPSDPDNAMRTQVARDIATLLAIRPGEDVPGCLPMGFMFEDDAIATARVEGQKVIVPDGGNSQFLEDLKKWKVTVKETDGESVVAHKSQLIDAQLELLDGIKEGISVNDAIKAAYEFRLRAAEARRSMVDMITELRNEQGEDASDEDTVALIKKCNRKLAAEGIVEIDPSEVIEDYEPPPDDDDGEEDSPGGEDADGNEDNKGDEK